MEQVRDYELKAFFNYVVDVLERLEIPYKHLRDARGVLMTQWGRLDVEAIRRGARSLGTLNEFEAILEAARREIEE